jgi:hypothetical protein
MAQFHIVKFLKEVEGLSHNRISSLGFRKVPTKTFAINKVLSNGYRDDSIAIFEWRNTIFLYFS